jgi:hypothetical protein
MPNNNAGIISKALGVLGFSRAQVLKWGYRLDELFEDIIVLMIRIIIAILLIIFVPAFAFGIVVGIGELLSQIFS